MSRLTDKDYWEGVYQAAPAAAAEPVPTPERKRLLKRLFGPRLMDMLSAYDDYLLWQAVLPRFLPRGASGLSVVEIGSAPGDFLVRFARTFGAEVYGVEYTSHGAERNRQVFAAAGYSTDQIIEADFFADAFLATNAGRFDIVVSRGFIEHFVDARAVVERHVALLKDGGLLLILIPNLRGIYGTWTRRFNPDQLPLHNLELMKAENFRDACAVPGLDVLRCGHFGTFSFWMFTASPHARIANRFIRLLHIVQRGLNLLLRLVFGRKGCESALFSPNLIFVARKPASKPKEVRR
ncbi:class I SAM-dependent methyltransferase [Propionivibrio sp.]|uniref:class I SAM-dependent methyltransferase n=1 Tax=Propionivibrio sp. TaxID=2212460 RepID=UPI0025ECEADA|nr:class I SAM-dependent methyltransferase [Propionivibrio sp.]MBK8743876.1 class I SAM-dependent methyltransferase [Propionivibrio sp.]